MPHDQLFKDVLRIFFQEMLELFAPNIAHAIDPEATEFLDSQLFTDLPEGALRVADQVAQVQPLVGPPRLVLIHTEVQVKDEGDLPFRIWEYTAALTLRHGPPVISIALRPFTVGDGVSIARYTEQVFGYEFTKLEYIEVALRGLEAAEYLTAGPVLGAALAALMRPGDGGTVDLKVAIVDRLRRSGLDEARLFLLVNFVETYLVLTPAEQAEVRARTFPEGGESVEAVEMTWADRLIQQGLEQGLERGIEQGALEAKRAIVPLQLRARFGSVPDGLAARLAELDEIALDRLLERVVRAVSLDEFMAGLP